MNKYTTSGGRRRKESNILKCRKTRACLSIEVSIWQGNNSFEGDIDGSKISTSSSDLSAKFKMWYWCKPNRSPLKGTGTKRLPCCTNTNPIVAVFWGLLEGRPSLQRQWEKGGLNQCLFTNSI